MICLTTTSDVLRIVTSAAVALDVHASFVENTAASYTPGRQNTPITTATTTTVLAAPVAATQRGLKKLSVVARGGANTIAVEHFDGTTATRLLSVALAAGETLEYEDAHGWRVLTVDGAMKGIGPQGGTGPTGATGATGATGVAGATGAAGPGFLNSLSTLNWTPGSPATITHLLLAAGHPAGMYQIHRAVVQLAASVVGTINSTTTWKPPNAALQTLTAPQHVAQHTTGSSRNILAVNLANSTLANVGIAMPLPSIVLVSDGSADIAATFSHSGVVVNFDLYSSINRVG